jgi:hypothetical protein
MVFMGVSAFVIPHPTIAQTDSIRIDADRPYTDAADAVCTPSWDLWSREELKRQSLPETPELGYDILTRSTRAVSLCLLESLGEATTSDGPGAADFTSD